MISFLRELDGHAEMLSTWQPGVVLAMTDPVIQSAFVILVSCCSVNVGGTIDSESYSGLDPKARLPETFCVWVFLGHTLYKTVMVLTRIHLY